MGIIKLEEYGGGAKNWGGFPERKRGSSLNPTRNLFSELLPNLTHGPFQLKQLQQGSIGPRPPPFRVRANEAFKTATVANPPKSGFRSRVQHNHAMMASNPLWRPTNKKSQKKFDRRCRSHSTPGVQIH